MRVLRLVVGSGGVALIGYAVYGLLSDARIRAPLGVAGFALAGVVLHDGVWLPLVCVVGALVARSVPVRTGLTVAAALTVVGLPVVLRAGADHGNVSLLPLPYLRNLLLLLGAVAMVTAGWEAQRRGLPGRAVAALLRAVGRRRRVRAERRRERRAAHRARRG